MLTVPGDSGMAGTNYEVTHDCDHSDKGLAREESTIAD